MYNAQSILLGGLGPNIPALTPKIRELVLLSGFGILTNVSESGSMNGIGTTVGSLNSGSYVNSSITNTGVIICSVSTLDYLNSSISGVSSSTCVTNASTLVTSTISGTNVSLGTFYVVSTFLGLLIGDNNAVSGIKIGTIIVGTSNGISTDTVILNIGIRGNSPQLVIYPTILFDNFNETPISYVDCVELVTLSIPICLFSTLESSILSNTFNIYPLISGNNYTNSIIIDVSGSLTVELFADIQSNTFADGNLNLIVTQEVILYDNTRR